MRFGALEFDTHSRNDGTRLVAFSVITVSFVALVVCTTQLSIDSAAAAMAAWVALLWVAIFCVRNRFENVVMSWLVLFPYCYYFYSFPRDHPLFTVDRALLLLVVLVLNNNRRQLALVPLMPELKVAGAFWITYVLICLISLWGHAISSVLGSYRLILDGVVMPALLGLYALRLFPIMGNLRRVHACTCLLMIGLAVVSLIELLSGTNIFPWPGAIEEWVQSDAVKILRIDGPFESSGILCLVGTFGFFFIVYSGRVLGAALSAGQSLLHRIGILAALGAAMMPMNRGLVIALFVCAALDYFASTPLVPRRVWHGIFGGLLLAAMVAWLFYPSVFEDRVSRGDNFYQRIAQNQQTLMVVMDHPLVGAGFNLYHDLVVENSRYKVSWHGFEAMNIPHSSLFTVLAEGGVVGFLAYIGAQAFFVRAMWRLRGANRLGWRAFLYCVLTYNIYGLDAGIVYFSDLNLFYMFMAGAILQMQIFFEDHPAYDTFCQ